MSGVLLALFGAQKYCRCRTMCPSLFFLSQQILSVLLKIQQQVRMCGASLSLSLNLALVQKIQSADDLGFKIAAFKADVCRSAGSLCDSKAIHRVLMSHCLSLNEKYIYHWRRLYLLLSKLLPCFCSKSTQAKINSGIPDVWCPCLSP